MLALWRDAVTPPPGRPIENNDLITINEDDDRGTSKSYTPRSVNYWILTRAGL